MKKILLAVLSLSLLTSCAGNNDLAKENETLKTENQALKEENEQIKAQVEEVNAKIDQYNSLVAQEQEKAQKQAEQQDQILSIDDEWVVDGQWKLKILDVKATDERNQASDKNPAQVIVVSYTYENLGFEDSVMDGLFLTPDQVIDDSGSVGSTYPLVLSNVAAQAPVGAKIELAEEAFGLNNESSEVLVHFVQYDGNDQKQRATFKVPVN
ncbi:hypothetical protein [Anaerococcus sp. AGMB09787]|uniref:hypothetical protein n=1 Tax=Anaerococcus sp. AGMB09787 TaxID=2922869 RepID=UPI001FB02662|nr:hypothetical protein [Anaerococcus sp. AGMB09787]